MNRGGMDMCNLTNAHTHTHTKHLGKRVDSPGSRRETPRDPPPGSAAVRTGVAWVGA